MEAQYLAWHISSTLAGTPGAWGKSQPLYSEPRPPWGPRFCAEQGLRSLCGKEPWVLFRTKLAMTLGCGEELCQACLGYGLWGVGGMLNGESWAG